MNIPENAIKMKVETWWNVMAVGAWTPGNTERVEKFDLQRLEQIVKNTKELKIDKQNYPSINLEHNTFGESYGAIEDLRVKDNAIQVKVGYLTQEANDLIKSGKYLKRSVEINIADGKEYIVNLALLGAMDGAVESLEDINPNFSKENENEDKDIECFLYMGGEKMAKEKEKEKEVLVDPSPAEAIEVVDNDIEDYRKLKKETLEFAEYRETTKKQLIELTRLVDTERTLRKKAEYKAWADKHRIPQFSIGDVTELLFAIDNQKEELGKLDFSKERKMNAIEGVQAIIELYSKNLEAYRDDIVNQDEVEGKFFYNGGDTNEAAYIKFVENNANDGEGFNDANNRLQSEGKIVLQ